MALNLRVSNNSLVASHFPLTALKPQARITADTASGSGTLTVDNITGFSVGQFILLGVFGEPTAEIIRVHTVTAPSGTTITLNSNTVYDHFIDTPVTVLDYNQVEFNRATTLTGVKTVLATSNISADDIETIYIDLTNTTGYAFFRFKNSASGSFSAYSDGVPYTGNPASSVEKIAFSAITQTGGSLNDDFSEEQDLIDDINEAQRVIQSIRDWGFEIVNNTSSLVTVQGETDYSVDSLTYAMKYPDSKQSVFSMRIGNHTLDYIDYKTLEDLFEFSADATLTADATVGATSITISDSSSFQDSGTVYLRTNGFVSYTAKDDTTNTLSGISVTAITTLVPSGATVWQNINVGTPNRYTLFNNTITLDIPPDTTNAGIAFKVKYLKKLTDLTSFASTTEIPFYHVLQYYVAYRIQLRKKNFDEAQKYLDLFTKLVELNVAQHKIQVSETYKYYVLGNTAKVVVEDEDQL